MQTAVWFAGCPPFGLFADTIMETPQKALTRAVNRAIAEGSPVVTEQTAGQHTPGPWITYDRPENTADGCEAALVILDSKRSCIAEVFAVGDTRDISTPHANARLIAAAPDLLLFAAFAVTDDGAMAERSHEFALKRLRAITDLARAAIAKAEVAK